jgi:hypothetical protein
MAKTPARRAQRLLQKLRGGRVSLAFVCDERWEDMAVVSDHVRRCASCDRDVHDFVGRDAEELRAALRENRGMLCGQVQVRPDGRVVDGACAPAGSVRGGLMWEPDAE